MHKKVIAMLTTFYLIIGCFIIFSPNEKCEIYGNEIFVDDDFYPFRDGTAEHPYETINKALREAEDGDIIYVFGGDYNETLNINKKVTLMGSIEEGNSIINYGATHRFTVQITADNVNMTGFNLTDEDNTIISEINGALIKITSSNVIIHNNNLTNCRNGGGIYLESCEDHIIKDNKIEYAINGIYSYYSSTIDFVGNEITNCSSAGIKVRSGHHLTFYNNTLNDNIYGIYALDCSNVNITNNEINRNQLRGVGIYDGAGINYISDNDFIGNINEGLFLSSPRGFVYNNTFEENQMGIRLSSNNYNIHSNTINDSVDIGLKTLSSSYLNRIYQNNFKRNQINAEERGNNMWYNKTTLQGNSWDDYNHIDIVGDFDKDGNPIGDGIGDAPYSQNGVYDLYPTGIFLEPPKKPSSPSPGDGEDDIGLKITLSVKVVDPENEIMDVYFYNTSDVLLGIDYNVFSNDRATCSFNLPFDTFNYGWYVIVKDPKLQNRSDTWFFSTKGRPASNIPPVADAGGPYYANIGELITFDASNSYDPDGNIEFYRWNFDDYTSEILSVMPTHRYESSGTYNVTLTVFDNNGSSKEEIVKVYVFSVDSGNQSPVADCGGPYEGFVGDTIVFDASGSSDPDELDSISQYNWVFEDGKKLTGEKPSRSFSSPGNYSIKLTVTDQTGRTDEINSYILVKPVETEESPGFEFVLLIISILLIGVISKRKRN